MKRYKLTIEKDYTEIIFKFDRISTASEFMGVAFDSCDEASGKIKMTLEIEEEKQEEVKNESIPD